MTIFPLHFGHTAVRAAPLGRRSSGIVSVALHVGQVTVIEVLATA